jgi:hypothetical protein
VFQDEGRGEKPNENKKARKREIEQYRDTV